MPSLSKSSSDNVTIDSLPTRKLSQNADTEPAPGNLPAMPTTAIALSGTEDADWDSMLVVTRVVLPSAATRLAGALRHVAGLDRALRRRVRCCPTLQGPVDGRDRR